MIGSLRNFAKTKLAGLLVVIMIIPFVFGMEACLVVEILITLQE